MTSNRSLRKRPPQCEGVQSNKRDIATSTDDFVEQSLPQQSLGIVQSPVFNIHIHVPSEEKNSGAKMYLPRIQPIIHIHFDELAKNLKNNEALKGQKLNSRFITDVISQTSPKFGGVSFHSKRTPSNRKLVNQTLQDSTPKRVLRSNRTREIDLGEKQEDKSEPINETVSEIHDECTNESSDINKSNISLRNTDEKTSTELSSNKSPVKLKEAVVVLEDIFKSKSFEDIKFSNCVKLEEHSGTAQGSSLMRNLNPKSSVEKDSVSDFSESDSCDSCEESDNLSEDNVANTVDNTKGVGNKCKDWEMLLSLTEGCNFSDLLKKFKSEGICVEGCKKKSVCLEKANKILENEKELQHTVTTETIYFTKKVKVEEELGCDESCERHSAQEKEDIKNENKENSNENNFNNCIDTMESEDQLSLDMFDGKETNTWPESDSVESNSLESENDNESEKNQAYATEPDSGDRNITASYKQVSEVVENLVVVGLKSPDKTSNFTHKSDCGLLGNNLFKKEHQSVDSECSEEEMSKKVIKEKKEKKRSHVSESSSKSHSPPKKMKGSDKKSDKSPKNAASKSSANEEYIPLNVSQGPTQFAVTPLPNIQPYKTHSAKNFKHDMLFGNRVQRFSSSNEFYMLKLKKKTRRLNKL